MPFKVIEQFVAGKSDDPGLCEDILHISDHYIGIIDGAGIEGRMFGTKTSGRYIAELIDAALHDLPGDCGIEDGTKRINAYIRKALDYADSAAVMRAGRRPAASVMILSHAREELWAYGDTLLRMDGVDHDLGKKIDEVTTAARCTYVRAQLLAGKSVDDMLAATDDRELIQPLLGLQQACFLNNTAAGDLGYGNIDGADEVLDFTRVISCAGAQHIEMASDGYIRLMGNLADTERELFAILKRDPLMVFKHPQVKGLKPGQKTFDDRMYVRLQRA